MINARLFLGTAVICVASSLAGWSLAEDQEWWENFKCAQVANCGSLSIVMQGGVMCNGNQGSQWYICDATTLEIKCRSEPMQSQYCTGTRDDGRGECLISLPQCVDAPMD